MSLQRFREDMARLGHHPDKDIIVKLTTMAMQQQNRARDIVDLIQSAVLNVSNPCLLLLYSPSSLWPLCFSMCHTHGARHGARGEGV